MKALVYEGPRQLNIREIPDPVPQTDEVLIKVAYSGICGSELGGYLGHNSLRKPPLVMGHEFSGEIIALGSEASRQKPELAIGQRVTVNPLIHSASCRIRACAEGRRNLCQNREIIGIHRPGSYADYVKAPVQNVYPLPDGLSLEHAALAEPLGCAVRAAKLAGGTPMDKVLITGLGPIGLLILQVIQRFGVTDIVATDTDPDRRAIGEAFEVRILDPLAEDVVALLQSETQGAGVDIAIDAVGAAATRKQCLDAVTRGGQVVFVGLHEDHSSLPVNDIIRKEINLQGSFAYAPLDFEDALNWLAADRIKIDPWLVKAPLSEGQERFEQLLGKPGPVAKILLYT
jgi:2-desacetyl-2-hydroxyethyl bacteriochlorophyllide A dehydrogenase